MGRWNPRSRLGLGLGPPAGSRARYSQQKLLHQGMARSAGRQGLPDRGPGGPPARPLLPHRWMETTWAGLGLAEGGAAPALVPAPRVTEGTASDPRPVMVMDSEGPGDPGWGLGSLGQTRLDLAWPYAQQRNPFLHSPLRIPDLVWGDHTRGSLLILLLGITVLGDHSWITPGRPGDPL